MSGSFFAGIEAGGTKVLCAVGDEAGRIVDQARIQTADPATTLSHIAEFFRCSPIPMTSLQGVGIASFGPLDLDRASTTYGSLTSTPKSGWSFFDIRGEVAAMLDCPVEIDTDVNAAALAEGLFGAAVGLDRFCYVTIGTGIGVGVIENGTIPNTTGHPEAGHMCLPRVEGDDFAGTCTFHKDCAEGLASGPAMRARWDFSAEELPDEHVAWEFEAQYIASICQNLTYTLRPQRIILGGGVMERSSIYEKVQRAFRQRMSGYALDRYSHDEATYIARPVLVSPSPGLVGALQIAKRAARQESVDRND